MFWSSLVGNAAEAVSCWGYWNCCSGWDWSYCRSAGHLHLRRCRSASLMDWMVAARKKNSDSPMKMNCWMVSHRSRMRRHGVAGQDHDKVCCFGCDAGVVVRRRRRKIGMGLRKESAWASGLALAMVLVVRRLVAVDHL